MMKFICLLALLGAFSAQASVWHKSTLDTLITCQHDDGATWLEVGINTFDARSDSRFLRAYVVVHNKSDGRAELVAYSQEISFDSKTGLYMDFNGKIKLAVSRKSQSALVANLSVAPQYSWDKGIEQDQLECTENSTVTFDYNSK